MWGNTGANVHIFWQIVSLFILIYITIKVVGTVTLTPKIQSKNKSFTSLVYLRTLRKCFWVNGNNGELQTQCAVIYISLQDGENGVEIWVWSKVKWLKKVFAQLLNDALIFRVD